MYALGDNGVLGTWSQLSPPIQHVSTSYHTHTHTNNHDHEILSALEKSSKGGTMEVRNLTLQLTSPQD